jgi:hypothetical protein
LQPKLTNPRDFSSNSSAIPGKSLDSPHVIGDGLAADNNDQGQIYKCNERIFVLCDACFWATTYLDKSRLPILDSRCSRCQEIGLSSFPVLANESFTYDYSEKRGVELQFMNRDG